jgi:hypothetical protein
MTKEEKIAGEENFLLNFQEYVSTLWKELTDGSQLVDGHTNRLIRSETEILCSNCKKWWPKDYRKCSKQNGGCGVWLAQAEKADLGVKKTKSKAQSPNLKWIEYTAVTKSNQEGGSQVVFQPKNLDYNEPLDNNEKNANSPLISLDEPIFVNPNSHSSIKTILRTIGSRAGVKQYGGNQREWITIICDGLPYGLVQTVIESTIDKETGKMEFGWVHLLPGLLHEEMNMVKGS